MKLYIGNLSFDLTEDSLKKAFSEFGNVEEVTIIFDKFTKRSKGFGFVTFSDDEAAKKAIAEMNGKELEGRALKVSEAKPLDNSDRPRRSFGGNQSRGYGQRNSGRSFNNNRR